MRFLEIARVAAELDLQIRRASGEMETAELHRDALQELHARAQFFFGQASARWGVSGSQELSSRRNADTAKDSLGLADVDLVRREKDVRAELLQLRFARVWIAFRWRKACIRIAHVDCVQKRLVMHQRRVVDVQ